MTRINQKKSRRSFLCFLWRGGIAGQRRDRIGRGRAEYRRLVNEPSNVMTPAQLATEALLAGADSGFDVKIYDLAEIKKLGMKAFWKLPAEVTGSQR